MDGDPIYWDGKPEWGVGESRALFDHDKFEVARRHLSGDAKQWCVWSSGVRIGLEIKTCELSVCRWYLFKTLRWNEINRGKAEKEH